MRLANRSGEPAAEAPAKKARKAPAKPKAAAKPRATRAKKSE
jgi:hypothetical protein